MRMPCSRPHSSRGSGRSSGASTCRRREVRPRSSVQLPAAGKRRSAGSVGVHASIEVLLATSGASGSTRTPRRGASRAVHWSYQGLLSTRNVRESLTGARHCSYRTRSTPYQAMSTSARSPRATNREPGTATRGLRTTNRPLPRPNREAQTPTRAPRTTRGAAGTADHARRMT
jgi:hypothetical protein